MTEIKALTSLRALAAFLVFMYHYAFLFPPASRGVAVAESVPLLAVWRSGQVGVSIFFVLSGFLITRIYYDEFSRGAGRLRLYFVKRFARIWPLFLVLCLIQHGVGLFRGDRPDATWLVTWTMTQGFFEDLRYAGLPTAWTLTIEESFYAIAPLLCVVLGKLAFPRGGSTSSPRIVARFALVLGFSAAVLFGVSWAAMHLVRAVGWTFGGFLHDTPHLLHATLGGRFPEFAIGVAGAFVHRTGRLSHWLGGARASWLALACLAAIGLAMAGKDVAGARGLRWQSYVLTYGIALAAGTLILALTCESSRISRWLAARPVVYLGKISYGFYLVQVTVLMTPLLALTDRLGPWGLPALCLLMNGLCALLYEIVERPARRWIVARFGGRASPARPVASD